MAKMVKRLRRGKETLVSRSVILWQKRKKKREAETKMKEEQREKQAQLAARNAYKPLFE